MPKMKKNPGLGSYEQEIEDNLDSVQPVANQTELINSIEKAAKKHVRGKKPITIRVSVDDLEAIKIKASKCGLPYQTYLNMIIHKDAVSK